MKTTLTLVLAALLATGLLFLSRDDGARAPEAVLVSDPPARPELPPSPGSGPWLQATPDATGRTALVVDAAAEPQAGLPTAAELLAAVRAYDAWLEGLGEQGRADWFLAQDFEGLDASVAADLLVDRVDIAPHGADARHADERLYKTYRNLGRALELDLLGHAVARFHRRSLDPREDLFSHGVSCLFRHLDPEGLAAGRAVRVVQALSDYLASWRPDGHLTGSPGDVLLPLLHAAGDSRRLLREALVLIEEAGKRGALATSEVMYHVALLPAHLRRLPDLREQLEDLMPWLAAPDRTEGMAWGHVELLRSLVSDGILTAAEVSGHTYLSDHLFEREPRVAWAAIELLSNFGDETGGARLAALFHRWLERVQVGDDHLREKDLALLLDLATSAPGGLTFEELVPLVEDERVGHLVLFAMQHLAERHPGDERIGEVWREALAGDALDPDQRERALALMIEHGFATVAELDGWLADPLLGGRAAVALVALDQLRPGPMRELALTSDDPTVASELAKALVRSDPAAGQGLARDLLAHGQPAMRNRGAAWLLGMGALAERRGHPELAASYRQEVLALPTGSLDAAALGLDPDLGTAALVEALTASFLAGGEALDGTWFAELVPPAVENP